MPVATRAPPELALRIAPGSPELLSRSAETELTAGRLDNAQALAEKSLARAPFSVRALRVAGLAEARLGSPDRANEMITLAGNWSLRDDAAHGWLTEQRLRRGDYGSAFAHADTLARRRPGLQPTIFRLFTTAAADPRAVPHLVRLMAVQPPWRQAYLNDLNHTDAGAALIGNLAIALQSTDGRFSDQELEQVYTVWASAGRLAGLRALRDRLGRPDVRQLLQNGDFSRPIEDQIIPFGWRLGASAGISVSVTEDDLRTGNTAARIDYDGFNAGVFLEQLLQLEPGSYRLIGQRRDETLPREPLLFWHVVCLDGGGDMALTEDAKTPASPGAWHGFQAGFTVPASNCTTQWLRLQSSSGERLAPAAMWFDDLEIAPVRESVAR